MRLPRCLYPAAGQYIAPAYMSILFCSYEQKKKKLAFVFGVFCTTVLLMAVQKPVFLSGPTNTADGTAQASPQGSVGVVWHGLTLDGTKSQDMLPCCRCCSRHIALVGSPGRSGAGAERLRRADRRPDGRNLAVDVELLYRHWGFRLDSTV